MGKIVVCVLAAASAGFLVWMVVKYLTTAPAAQNWSVAGILISGVVMMLVARFWLRSPFFQVRPESDPG